ncbi:MAG TPA: hypothetical protein VF069_17990 [Streptosporangiaceae bacterium]
MVENAIPGEARLSLYISSRYLQELGVALRLIGIASRYERPGIGGLPLPRLCVPHPGRLGTAIYAIPRSACGAAPQWWFEWTSCRGGWRRRICSVTDLPYAARVIAEQLRGDA